MREVIITVTSFDTGKKAHITSYPYRPNHILYKVPLYRVTVSGTNKTGEKITQNFEAIRFGVHRTVNSQPKVVGLADKQSYVLSWDNIRSMPGNAWRAYAGFFIHKGPEYPLTENYGSIGCIEITGSGSWATFNNLIMTLAGVKNENEASRSKLVKVEYKQAARPPLVIVEAK